MWLQKQPTVALIAVLGVILMMKSSVTEGRSYSTAGYIGHRNDDSTERSSSKPGDGERCVGKLGIDVMPPENTPEIDASMPYSICKWTNTTEEPTRPLEESKLELIFNGSTTFPTEWVTEKPRVQDFKQTAATIESTDIQQTTNDLLKGEYQSVEPERMKQRRLTTSKAITQRARTARLMSLFNTSESPDRNPDAGAFEDSLESPLIVSSPKALTGTRFSTRDKSSSDDKQPYMKKDQAKPSINLVDGKPSKVFYEIKPSLNTAMEDDIDDTGATSSPIVTTSKRHILTGFKMPSLPSSFGKFGPYFLDDVAERNVTERIGSTVLLNCRIGLLGDKKVTWLQHKKDTILLLTVGDGQYSADQRISLKFQYPDNWRLQIAYATQRDSGLYKCRVEIDHMQSIVKKYNVMITAPILNITDDSGRVISGERHLKAGSALKLRCEGRDILESMNESLLWTRGDETLTTNVSENRTSEIIGDREMPLIVSTLTVERATPRHAGNYSCIVPERAKTTIAVHVLNGELPAAVHHGNGVSSAVLNLWLIHLTASCGLFR